MRLHSGPHCGGGGISGTFMYSVHCMGSQSGTQCQPWLWPYVNNIAPHDVQMGCNMHGTLCMVLAIDS